MQTTHRFGSLRAVRVGLAGSLPARPCRMDIVLSPRRAAVEEGEDKDIRAVFETNFFGLAAMIRAVLPGMRARRHGFIVNIASVGGFVGFPGSGYYAATKFAVEGLSQSLAREVEPLGIRVLLVEPGPFRTDWAGRSLKQSPNFIGDYEETSGRRRRNMTGYSGRSRAIRRVLRRQLSKCWMRRRRRRIWCSAAKASTTSRGSCGRFCMRSTFGDRRV